MQTKNEPGSLEWTDSDDAPPLTVAMLQDAEVFEGDAFVRRGPGRPPTGNAKELVSLRLDRDVLAKLRESGPGWQTQVNLKLRAALGLDQPPMVDIAGVGARPLDTTVEDAQAEKAAAGIY